MPSDGSDSECSLLKNLLYSTLVLQVSIVSTDFHKICLQVVFRKQDMGFPVFQLPGFRWLKFFLGENPTESLCFLMPAQDER